MRMLTGFSFCLLLMGCQTTSTISKVEYTVLPNLGLTKLVERRTELTGPKLLHERCLNSIGYHPPVITEVQGPDGTGLDDRYNNVSRYFRAQASRCFAGENKACRAGNAYVVDWAKSNGPKNDRSKYNYTTRWNTHVFWNDTLTVNMRLTVPILNFLAISVENNPLREDDRKLVNKWLKKNVLKFEHMMRDLGNYSFSKHGFNARLAAHNHAVMSSNAHMALGSWMGDKNLFHHGLEQWEITLRSMRDDGSLPIETRRGSRALFYLGRTIAGLIQIAERARVQGIDLYQDSYGGKDIHKTIQFFLDVVEAPDLIIKYAKKNKSPGSAGRNYKIQDVKHQYDDMYSWIAPYIYQFPNHKNTKRILGIKHGKLNYLSKVFVQAPDSHGSSTEWLGMDAACFASKVSAAAP